MNSLGLYDVYRNMTDVADHLEATKRIHFLTLKNLESRVIEMRAEVGLTHVDLKKFSKTLFDPPKEDDPNAGISAYGAAIKAHARIDAIVQYLDEEHTRRAEFEEEVRRYMDRPML